MSPEQRKTLPKDFEAALVEADLDVLEKFFDTCQLHPRGGVPMPAAAHRYVDVLPPGQQAPSPAGTDKSSPKRADPVE
jgi:hypothetical protein